MIWFVSCFPFTAAVIDSCSQQLLPVNGLDPHPEEEDGDECDDEDHQERHRDADESGSVDTKWVGERVCIDNDFLFRFFFCQRELNVVGGQDLEENKIWFQGLHLVILLCWVCPKLIVNTFEKRL